MLAYAKRKRAARRDSATAAHTLPAGHTGKQQDAQRTLRVVRLVIVTLLILPFLSCIYDQIFWVQNDTGLLFVTIRPEENEQEPAWIVALANAATGKVSLLKLANVKFNIGSVAPSQDAEFLCFISSDNNDGNIQVFQKGESAYRRKATFPKAMMNPSANPWSPRERIFACWTPPSMLSPDAQKQATNESAEGEGSVIVLYNADRNTSSPLQTPPGFARLPVWSNDGNRVAFYLTESQSSEVFNLCIADPSSGRIETLARELQGTNDDADFFHMSCAWSPHDTEIVVPEGNAFLFIDVSTKQSRRLPIEPDDPCADPPPFQVYYPRFSPDGKYFTFCGTQAQEKTYGKKQSDIWLASTADKRPRRITTLPGDEYAPAWNARSDRIAFLYGSENCLLIAGTVDLERSIKWYTLDASQRLALAKDYVTLFDHYYDTMREWKVKTDEALDTAMSFLQKVSYKDRATTEVKKLYDEVFKELSERVKQR
jgi:Tol biopolymer transport system component